MILKKKLKYFVTKITLLDGYSKIEEIIFIVVIFKVYLKKMINKQKNKNKTEINSSKIHFSGLFSFLKL
jgi:hypothetical protein